MPRIFFSALIVIVVLGAGSGAWWLYDRSNTGFALLTEDEIAEIARNPASKNREILVVKTGGPLIRVKAPSGFALRSPVDFDIRVEPRGGIGVDMGTLRIEYKLGPVWVNLTRRVMREAKINGYHFLARGAELPPGNHSLRLTVHDQEARITQALVRFSVKK